MLTHLYYKRDPILRILDLAYLPLRIRQNAFHLDYIIPSIHASLHSLKIHAWNTAVIIGKCREIKILWRIGTQLNRNRYIHRSADGAFDFQWAALISRHANQRDGYICIGKMRGLSRSKGEFLA